MRLPHPILFVSLLVATALAGCIGTNDLTANVATAQLGGEPPYRLDPIAEGLDRPVQFVPDPRTPAHFLVAEMGGTVRLVDVDAGPDHAVGEILLDLGDRLTPRHREQGLLGLALHPAFPEDPRLFVTYTAPNDDVVLASFPVPAAGPVDNRTETQLLRVPQHKPYHNGGHIAFGPDGHLYAAFGDGSPQGDPDGNAQDLSSLLGTMIRIDVGPTEGAWSVPADNPFVGKEGRDEVWLYGLRNPWRFSFDADNGDLWIGDVGFLAVEEIDRVPAALGGGHNLGWPRWEGTRPLATDRTIEVPVLFPVHEYPRLEPCSSVTGGFVARDPDLPDLHGAYLFGDFCTGGITALRSEDGRWAAETVLDTGLPLAGFAQGPDHAVYAISYTGGIHRLTASA